MTREENDKLKQIVSGIQAKAVIHTLNMIIDWLSIDVEAEALIKAIKIRCRETIVDYSKPGETTNE